LTKNNYKYSLITIIVAAILWYVMFVIKPFNFWIEMSGSIGFLTLIALIMDKDILKIKEITSKQILIGILSAILLYIVFYIGNIITGYIFPFKNAQVLSIYSNKTQGNSLWIGLLLLLVIGPGEELYWRGFIQSTLSNKFGENKGYVFATLLYGGVHILTGNIMLIIAALVCGIYWGWIYKKQRSILTVIISHAIWDLTIFVLFPIM
jgi:uncharacterized protein